MTFLNIFMILNDVIKYGFLVIFPYFLKIRQFAVWHLSISSPMKIEFAESSSSCADRLQALQTSARKVTLTREHNLFSPRFSMFSQICQGIGLVLKAIKCTLSVQCTELCKCGISFAGMSSLGGEMKWSMKRQIYTGIASEKNYTNE